MLMRRGVRGLGKGSEIVHMAIVDRKFSQQSPDPQGDAIHPKSLCDFFKSDALVVLGDPGAGKTTSFEQAASEEPDAVYVKIRDFLTLKTKQYTGKTLYLDGLDEQRSKSNDGTAILDDLRQRLDELGTPRFRLSCRSADWYGSSDLEGLNAVAPSESITVVSIEPLSEADVVVIATGRVPDPILFLEEAHRRGVDELLTNPQTLELILTVVGKDDWPTSRTELFEKACEILLREENTEHGRAHQGKADNKRLLQAAGYLCAVCLCSGLEGVALSTENSEENFPYVGDLEQDAEVLQLVAQRPIFKGAGPEQRMPLHRTVAEFLAASYFKNRISNYLPIGRVKSILTGYDGGTLSDLRGLYAWLTCLSPQFAPSLIPVDPLGIILYGDVAPLVPSIKKLFLANLQSLAKRHPWFRHSSRDSVPFGALACHELVQDFSDILADPDESITVKSCVIDAIQHGSPLPELSSDVMLLARNSGYAGYIRRDAIKAYFHLLPENHHELNCLLDDINTGVVPDNDLYLRGALLRTLYPDTISAAKIATYLVADKSNVVGAYSFFLSDELVEKTSDKAIPDLIEAVAQSGKLFGDDYTWGRFIGRLVARGLNLYGESIEIEKLYKWLSITLDDDEFCSEIGNKEKESIRGWLEAHPNRMLELLEFCVATAPSDKLNSMEYRFHAMILGNIQSPDLYKWLLSKAASETDQKKAEFFFSWAVRLLFTEDDHDKPTFEELYEFADRHPQFIAPLKYWLTSEIPDWRVKRNKRERERKIEKENTKAERIKILTPMLDLLRIGTHSGNLNFLAGIYKGIHPHYNKDLSPYERLVESTNPEIASAALDGFRAVLYREDIPTPQDIAQNRLKNTPYYIGLPLLIGMNLVSSNGTPDIISIPEATLKSAIAFHYVESDDNDPSWLNSFILGLRPMLAAEAFLDFWKPQLKADSEHIDGIYELDNKPEMEFIARSVSIPLLTEYPNCPTSSLKHLLWAALLHAKRHELLELTCKVLGKSGVVNGIQRVLWCSTGFLINPDVFVIKLRKYIGNDKDLTYSFLEHATGYLQSFQKGRYLPLDHLKLGMTIDIVARVFPPFDRSQKTDSHVTNSESASQTIHTLIDKLSSITEVAAGDVLKGLISQQSLKLWRDNLLHAFAIQQQNCREAAFRPLTIKQVIETIKGGKPANLPDLKEVVFDHLKTLRDEFRNGPLDGYKDFWNLDNKYGKATEAIPENNCRDRLLSRLKPLLQQQEIQAEPEGHFAEDKRADIKVMFSSMVLPVEIKRHYHKDVWTAPTEQLHKRYSRDPGAYGHGIYLIFWFGIDFKKVPNPPSNMKLPTTAAEMEEAIRKTIPSALEDKIEIIVFDCSRPKISRKLSKKQNLP